MWTGGNVGHYAPERPRVLIDGDPRRASWINLADLRAKGAVVVWTDADVAAVPAALRQVAPNAAVQPSFALPFHGGGRNIEIGWAIVRPEK
jgi:hypothetical protein